MLSGVDALTTGSTYTVLSLSVGMFSLASSAATSRWVSSVSLSLSESVSALHRPAMCRLSSEPATRLSLLGVNGNASADKVSAHVRHSLCRTSELLTAVTSLRLHFPQYSLLHFLQECFKHVKENSAVQLAHDRISASSTKLTLRGVPLNLKSTRAHVSVQEQQIRCVFLPDHCFFESKKYGSEASEVAVTKWLK
jgi:hypothetical protein